MVGHSLIQGLTTSTDVTPPLILIKHSSSCSLPCLASKYKKRVVFAKASSSNVEPNQPRPSELKSTLLAVLDVPRRIWKHTLRPLGDFGFGRRSIWEGGVGLFLVSGTVLFVLSLAWLKAFQIRSKFRKYSAVFEFPQACGISCGTPVRIRGVNVGNVIRVNSSLCSVEAVVELLYCLLADDKPIIPRNSLVEVYQSGLLMETMIDITPKDPLPTPSLGPLDPECDKECLIVCDRQTIMGREGVSLDALVGIFTRLGREVEGIGVTNVYLLADRVAAVVEEARPLLTKISYV